MPVRDARMNRQAVDVTSFDEQSGSDLAYWLSRTPAERIEALELLRQVHFGYDPATARLQRVPELIDSAWSNV